jgi:hypothetical protein
MFTTMSFNMKITQLQKFTLSNMKYKCNVELVPHVLTMPMYSGCSSKTKHFIWSSVPHLDNVHCQLEASVTSTLDY